MNTKNHSTANDTADTEEAWPMHEKICLWAILGMICYLVIAG